MSDHEINESVKTHISQAQFLPNDFVLGTAVEGLDFFFKQWHKE
jgi:hypothetical protein